MEGRWYTTGSGGGADPLGVLVFAFVVIAGSGVAAGIAEAVASLVMDLLIAAAAVIILATAGLAALVVHRIRHPESAMRIIPHPQYHTLMTPAAPKAVAPRQPPSIVNNYFGGSHTHHQPGPETTPAATPAPLVRGAITSSSSQRHGPAAS